MGNQGAPTVGAGAGGFCVVLPSGDHPSSSWRSGSCPRRRPGRPSCRSTRVACGRPTSMRGAPTPATNGSARRSSWATSWSALIVVLGPAGAEGTSAKPTPFATGQRGLPVSIASSERTARSPPVCGSPSPALVSRAGCLRGSRCAGAVVPLLGPEHAAARLPRARIGPALPRTVTGVMTGCPARADRPGRPRGLSRRGVGGPLGRRRFGRGGAIQGAAPALRPGCRIVVARLFRDQVCLDSNALVHTEK